METGILGLQPPEPLGLGGGKSSLLPVGDQGRENGQLQDVQGQEGGRKCLWLISQQI